MSASETPKLSFSPIVYVPSHGWISLNLREVWNYRELLVFLTWRDIKVRYDQAALGVSWAAGGRIVALGAQIAVS